MLHTVTFFARKITSRMNWFWKLITKLTNWFWKTAWRTWDLLTTYYSSPRHWKNYVKCSVSSRPAQKLWVWVSTRTKRRYSATRTEQRRKKLLLTTSKSKSWQKEIVQDISDRKSRSRNRKLKRSKTDWKQLGQRSTNIVKNWHRKSCLLSWFAQPCPVRHDIIRIKISVHLMITAIKTHSMWISFDSVMKIRLFV